MKNYNFVKTSIFAVIGVAVTLPSMFGNSVTPGNTVSPDVFVSLSGFTLLASTGPVVVNPQPGSSFNTTYYEAVGTDANNLYCANCLDFLIYATNNGPGAFERISTSSFGAFLTDVGYNSAAYPGVTPGGITPSTVNRSADGTVIAFNFIPPGSAVSSGQKTVLLEIQTNARNYTTGTVSVQDGVSGFGAGFAPTAAPEPVSMALLGSGLLLIGGLGKRFRRNQASK